MTESTETTTADATATEEPAKKTTRRSISKKTVGASLATTLDERLVIAQKALGEVKKDASNDFHGYDYTSAEEMLRACRKALTAAGLAARAAEWEFHSSDAGTIFLAITCEIGGEGLECRRHVVHWPVIAERGRPLDKATAGALTTALSYWLRNLLLVPREDRDVEVEARDDRKSEPAKSAASNGTATSKRRQPPPVAEKPKDVSGLAGRHEHMGVDSAKAVGEGEKACAVVSLWIGGEQHSVYVRERHEQAAALGQGEPIAGTIKVTEGRNKKQVLILEDWSIMEGATPEKEAA